MTGYVVGADAREWDKIRGQVFPVFSQLAGYV